MPNTILIIGDPRSQRTTNILKAAIHNPSIMICVVFPAQLSSLDPLLNWKDILCIVNLSYNNSRVDEIALKHNKRVFNSFAYCSLVQDKISTYNKLKDKVLQPVTYTRIEDIEQYPVVGKYSKGSLGKQVELIENLNNAIIFQVKYGHQNTLFQQYIASSYGIHLRAYCIGNKCVCAYNIINNKDYHDFKSNLANKNSYIEQVEIDDNLQKLVNTIYKEIPLDNMGIDFLYGPNKELILCEINAFPLIGGPTILNIDVQQMYFKYILKEMNFVPDDDNDHE